MQRDQEKIVVASSWASKAYVESWAPPVRGRSHTRSGHRPASRLALEMVSPLYAPSSITTGSGKESSARWAVVLVPQRIAMTVVGRDWALRTRGLLAIVEFCIYHPLHLAILQGTRQLTREVPYYKYSIANNLCHILVQTGSDRFYCRFRTI